MRKWEDVCVELRQVVSRKTVGQIPSAMILAFVGAIEQNVLKFPNQLGERLQHGHGVSLEVKNYLQKCIREEALEC